MFPYKLTKLNEFQGDYAIRKALSDAISYVILDSTKHAGKSEKAKALDDLLTDVKSRIASIIPVEVIVPTSIAVTPSPLALIVAATQQLSHVVSPTGSDQTVTYSSSDATKATVSSTGLVTAVAVGTAVITCTSASVDTVHSTVNVTVTAE